MTGLRGERFRFVRYVRTDKEEYVEVYGGGNTGPRTRFDPARDRIGGKLRCVTPDRLRTAKGRLP